MAMQRTPKPSHLLLSPKAAPASSAADRRRYAALVVRLTKAQSRQRWAELRELWRTWDPIGVMDMPDWLQDEYDAYLGPTMRLLESDASAQEISSYLAAVEIEHMGLSHTPQATLRRNNFAIELGT